MKANKFRGLFKANLRLLWFILPVIALCIVLAIFYSSFIPYLFYCNIIFLITALILCVLPRSGQVFSQQASALISSRWLWGGLLLLLQLFVTLFFWAMSYLLFHFTVINTQDGQILSPIHLITLFKWQWFMQPWSLVSLIAVALLYSHYRQHSPPWFNYCYRPIFGRHVTGIPGAYVIFYYSRLLAFIFAFFCILAILLLLFAFAHYFHLPVYTGLQPAMLLTAPILLLPVTSLQANKVIRYLAGKDCNLAVYFAFFILLETAILIILTLFFYLAYHYMGEQLPAPALARLQVNSWFIAYSIFAWCWWMSIAPLLASLVARLSVTRSARALIVVAAILPNVIVTAIPCLWPLPTLANWFANPHHILINLIIVGGGIIALLLGLLKTKDSRVFNFGFFVSDPYAKHARATSFLRGQLVFTSVLLAVFLLNGVLFLYGLAFVIVFPAIVILYLLCPSLCLLFMRGHYE